MRFLLVTLFSLTSMFAGAAQRFDGEWEVILCSHQKEGNCGAATFSIIQSGSEICGDHTFRPATGDRSNNGTPGSVRGKLIGHNGARLEVRSTSNGALVRGYVDLFKDQLHWNPIEETEAGSDGDSLILAQNFLTRTANPHSLDLLAACKMAKGQ